MGTHFYDGVVSCNLSNGVFPSRPFRHLDKMHPACVFTNHGRHCDSSPSGFLCAVFNLTFDGSDGSAYEHHCVLDEPVRFFVSFHCVLSGDFCFAHFQLHDF